LLLFYRSFGPKEDAFFRDVTELAAAEGLPLLYLAANSGARIGVAKEVQAAFQVGWVDDRRPNEGFQYLYLTDGDFEKFGSSVFAEKVMLHQNPLLLQERDMAPNIGEPQTSQSLECFPAPCSTPLPYARAVQRPLEKRQF
jgi:acetyl-CoA carboxylase carboxyltransferase component